MTVRTGSLSQRWPKRIAPGTENAFRSARRIVGESGGSGGVSEVT